MSNKIFHVAELYYAQKDAAKLRHDFMMFNVLNIKPMSWMFHDAVAKAEFDFAADVLAQMLNKMSARFGDKAANLFLERFIHRINENWDPSKCPTPEEGNVEDMIKKFEYNANGLRYHLALLKFIEKYAEVK